MGEKKVHKLPKRLCDHEGTPETQTQRGCVGVRPRLPMPLFLYRGCEEEEQMYKYLKKGETEQRREKERRMEGHSGQLTAAAWSGKAPRSARLHHGL